MSETPAPPPALRRRSTSLFAHGEGMVWLTGGSLLVCLVMIVGMLWLVFDKGLRTFWPTALVQVETLDGKAYLGEVTASREIEPSASDLESLEPEARGPYAGAVGYLSYSGDLDTCIAIRTLVVRENETSVTAGAGIVADSDPAAEERETKNKSAALLTAVALAEELERRS